MVKHYLTIGGVSIPNVKKIEITPFYRAESTITNMAGDMLTDRTGSEKLKLAVTLALTDNSAALAAIRKAYDDIYATFTFYRGTVLQTKTMKISAVKENTPIYLSGNRSKVYYAGVTLTAEER